MGELGHVLWIGGPPGVGKTTVAERLARRHGLRLYGSDARTWEHRDRAVAAGSAAAIRFEALSGEERRTGPLEQRLAMMLQRERGPMTVDDVRALPDSPLVVAEGTQVLPEMLPAGARAVWLMGGPEVRRVRLAERHEKWADLYMRLAELIEAAVADEPQIVVDGLSVDETVSAVEEFFADLLAAGPVAQGVPERWALLRAANLAEVERYRTYFARPWAEGDLSTATHGFVCECADPECTARVMLRVAELPDEPLLAPAHRR